MHKSINKVKHDAYTFYEHIKLNKIGEREIQTRDFVVVRSHLRDIRSKQEVPPHLKIY